MLNLLKSLHAVQSSIRSLGKDGKANGYSYLTGDKLLGHLRPEFEKHGLLLVPEIIEVANERVDYSTRSGNKSAMFTTLKMRFTWYHVESGESLACEWAANGMNDWDKGAGSAMTYGHRYFLIKFFNLPTDADDIDALGAEPAAPAKPSLTQSHPKWPGVVKALQDGFTLDQIKNKYELSAEVEAELIKQSK
jgi:hypothetical protein